MSITINFDASTVEPSQAFDVLPAGDYPVVLTEATTVETKAKDGSYMKCQFTVCEGPHKGRKLFDNLNLWNKSAEATKIAWQQLSALCHAANRLQVGDIVELYGIPVTAKVAIDPAEGQYSASNSIKSFSKAGAVEGGPPAGGFISPATPAAAPSAEVAAPALAAVPATPAPAAPEAAAAPPPWAAAPQPAAPVAAAAPAAPPVAAAPAAPAAPAAAPAATPAAPPWAQ